MNIKMAFKSMAVRSMHQFRMCAVEKIAWHEENTATHIFDELPPENQSIRFFVYIKK